VITQAPSLRLRTPLASLLLAVAAVAWVGVVVLARDMGSMPGTMGLGVGSFIAVWALMMAAMMLPSVTPFASLYTRTFGDDRGWRLAGFDPLDTITPNAFANLRERPAPYRCRSQLALGGTLAAFGRQGTGQRVRQEEVLLRPAALGQVVDDT